MPTAAQTAAAVPCTGQFISGISVTTSQPPELERLEEWERRLARIVGLLHTGTQPDVVRGYLRFRAGDRCSTLAVQESERLLRAQPFFADARIAAIPSGEDSVRVDVEIVEELRPNVGLRIERGQITRLRLGSSNYEGEAVAVTLLYRKGMHYRDGFGFRITDYQPFGEPLILNLESIRDPLGDNWLVSLREPYYTDSHPHSWYVGAEHRRTYHGFRRLDGPLVAMEIDRTQWLAGTAWRIGRPGRSFYLGPVVAGERSIDRGGPVLITDTGVVAYDGPGVPDVNQSYSALRGGALLGVHRIRHVVARGIDALTGPQDLRSGVEVLGLATRSMHARGNSSRDFLFGGVVYAGHADTNHLVAVHAEGETRRDLGPNGAWRGTVASARAAWYHKPSATRTQVASAEFSGGWNTRLPMQVTLSEREAGLRGFEDASVGGERRLVGRIEQRWIAAGGRSRFDMGVAAFVEGGRLWRGEAPFGETTSWQASAGVALLAAIPRGARHTWRFDVAIPLTNGGRPGSFELRARIADFTRHFWRDPGDIARVREGPLLSRVLGAH